MQKRPCHNEETDKYADNVVVDAVEEIFDVSTYVLYPLLRAARSSARKEHVRVVIGQQCAEEKNRERSIGCL